MKKINKLEVDFNDKAMNYDDTGIWIVYQFDIKYCCINDFVKSIVKRFMWSIRLLINGKVLIRFKNIHSLRDKI